MTPTQHFHLSRLVVFGAVVSLMVAPAEPARAQADCSVSELASPVVVVRSRSWPPPLDRRVTLEGAPATLRAALDRLGTAAGVRLSYLSDLLPLDRQVCLTYRRVAVGDVLTGLLRGTSVQPVAVGDDRIVLAPDQENAASARSEPERHRTTMLDRVVVTGSAVGGPQRSLPFALDVVSGSRLQTHDAGSISSILDGMVPGLWVWEQSPTSLSAHYGSIRGASSFGVSYPKIYLDGIEVANPLLFTHLDPQTVERIEVIRGPQGSALYGADAISGVINIMTRHGGAGPHGRQLQLRTTAGVAGSAFARDGVLSQQHSLTLRDGSDARSGGLAVNVGTLGAYLPGAFTRTISASGDLRVVGSRSVLTGVARLFSERAGTPVNPFAVDVSPIDGPLEGAVRHGGPGGTGAFRTRQVAETVRPLNADAGAQSVRQYTFGATLALTPNDRWTHSLVAGLDGYRLANARDDGVPVPSATDSALAAARGGADRATVRMSSVAQLGTVDGTSATLMLGAEHSAGRARTTSPISVAVPLDARDGGPGDRTIGEPQTVQWRSNSAVLAQLSTGLRHTLFMTAGLRLDHNDGFLGASRFTALPMLGAAVVGDRGDVTLKLRASYGKGIRPVQSAAWQPIWLGRRRVIVPVDLEPEQQSGVEGGADLVIGRAVSLHVTRFDQRASGLVQAVAIAQPAAISGIPSGGTAIGYQLQNVGVISNRGWEMQGSTGAGRLSLTGTFSLVDSRVRQLARGYSGDLRAGDRMLEVPGRTSSLTATWQGVGWGTSWMVARAADWTNYDRLALARAIAGEVLSPGDLVGPRLRDYWRRYDGVTRLGFSATRDLFGGVTLVVSGHNLLGRQRGEPDNVTIVPGRTITAGVRATF